jgi:riboflavin transporter FmnP
MDPNYRPDNQTRWSARQLATMALFIGLGAVLGFIPIPIWPMAATFGITYDPANVPATLGGLGFGTGPGLVIGILSSVVHGILTADMVGTGMNIVAVVGFLVPPAMMCKNDKSSKRMALGLGIGCLTSVALIIPANIFVWPNFFHMPLDATIEAIVPIMLPFNLLKAVLNAVLSFLLYKSLHKLMEG